MSGQRALAVGLLIVLSVVILEPSESNGGLAYGAVQRGILEGSVLMQQFALVEEEVFLMLGMMFIFLLVAVYASFKMKRYEE